MGLPGFHVDVHVASGVVYRCKGVVTAQVQSPGEDVGGLQLAGVCGLGHVPALRRALSRHDLHGMVVSTEVVSRG